jgi:hypothetical protein
MPNFSIVDQDQASTKVVKDPNREELDSDDDLSDNEHVDVGFTARNPLKDWYFRGQYRHSKINKTYTIDSSFNYDRQMSNQEPMDAIVLSGW